MKDLKCKGEDTEKWNNWKGGILENAYLIMTF